MTKIITNTIFILPKEPTDYNLNIKRKPIKNKYFFIIKNLHVQLKIFEIAIDRQKYNYWAEIKKIVKRYDISLASK